MNLDGYRTTPASADPYKYIRTGNYARILSQQAFQPGMMGTAAQKQAQQKAMLDKKMAALGLRG